MFPVNIGVAKQKTYDQFVSDWANEWNEAIQIAQQKADKSAEQNRNQYNRKVHGYDIVIGDRVLLQNIFEERRHWQITRSLGKHNLCCCRKRGQLTILQHQTRKE